MTHNSRLPFRIMLVLAALSAMIGLICFAQPVSQAAPAAIVQNNVTDARWLNLTTGPALAAPSGKITAVPLTLTSANFNNDTRPDLIVGYETAVGGFLALYPGSEEEAHFALPHSFPVNFAPHWLAPGDFNTDGRQDIVAAAQGGTTLFFFAGDGAGGFHEPKPLALPGPLTALAAGDLHRQDGLADLAVGVAAAEGARLLIYTGENGAQTAVPEIYPLPAPATNLAIGQLGDDGLFDVALTAGQTLLILHGRDQFALEPSAPAALASFSLAFMPTSLALGDFLSGDDAPVEIALPDSAGQIHLFSPTGEEVGGLETAVAGPARLLAADSSSLAGDDLFVMGENGRQLQILTADGQHPTSQEFSSPAADPGLLAALESAAPFIAGLPLRLNDDALDDLVLLIDGAPQPLVMTTTAVNVFVITSRFDDPDKTPGDGLCKTNNGFCTLRAAIQEANASPGADDIVCGLDSYATNPIVQPDSPLPAITEAVLLEGGARGTANCGKMEINGIAAGTGSDVHGLRLLGGSATVRNVAIYNFHNDGIFIDSGGNIVEESILGTNNKAEGQLSNWNGIYVADGQSNIIQHNIVSGNLMVGISVNGGSQTQIIKGNSIGFWPSSPPRALPNLWGIAINGGLSNLIGSITVVNGGNFIAGNHYGGIDLAPESSFTTVQANYVGVTTVNTGLSNDMGIAVRGPSNTIGGSTTGHNTIAYNTDGIHLYNTPATNNRVSYNIIGGAAGNLGDGIWVSDNASQNQITNNEIGSNGRSGIYIQADGTTCAKNQVRNNLIGTDQSYTADQGNGVDGILVKGVSCTTISTNRIYFNDRHGIYINAAQPVTATIELNSIARNGDSGILLSTSNNVVEGNTTSFNGQIGIWVQGSYNQLTANKAYGDDLSGYYQITGIRIDGSHNTLIGGDLYAPQSEISDHHGSGLELKGSYNSVQNYYIHSNWDAGIDITGDNNVVGGAGNGRNILSVNFDGIRLAVGAANNQILGNYIGTDLTGVYDAGNIVGVQIYGGSNQIGGTAVNAGNRIAYSQGPNISLNGSSATSSIIENNIIGPTVVDGSPGIEITNSASGNTLRSNQISSSRGAGIAITSGTNNRLLSNVLFGNSGLGIDLAPNGVTLNDTGDNDTGANQLQNFPVITTVTAGTSTRIQGTLSSKASTSYTLQFYANTACDTAGYGEGERLLGQTSVTTNSSGQAGFDVTLAVGDVLGQYVTATAADSSGNTSEFSKCSVGRPVSSGVPFTVNTTSDAVDLNIGDGICDSSAVTGQQCTLRAAVQEANFSVGADTIIIPAGTYALTLTGSDTAAAVGDLDITDTLTITGAGADTTTIQGSMSDRIFEIRNNAAVSIAGITIRGGAPASSNNGGGILVNSGTSLALEGMTVRNNATVSGGGGGIYSSGTLTITNSAIVSNTTTLSAPTSTGGGLSLLVGSAALINTTVSDNSAMGSGGGIYNIGASVRLQNVTVIYNTADADNNGGDGGGLYTSTSTFYLRNSIIAQNVDMSYGSYPYGYADCYGTYTSESYNLIGDQAKQNNTNPPGCQLTGGSSDSLGGFWLLTRYLTYWAGLGALQLNGGTTPSHAPLASAAGLTVDWGNPAVPGSGGLACEPFDQRGQPRPIDGGTDGVARCDRGAVEHVPSYLSIGDATAVEGSPAQFTVTLSEPAQITFTVQIATADLTALVGQDYNQLAGTLTFAPGQTSQNVQVATLTDTIDEDAETFRVQLSSPQYVFIADGEGVGTITDGNALPSIRVADRTVAEGAAGSSVQAVFAVSLNSASGKTVTVNYATADGSATAGADYLAAQGQVQFAPGVTTQNVSVTVLGDDLREGNETFTLQLSSPVNASLGDATGQGTITDDDIPAFSISDSSRLEGDSGTSSMVFTVWLSKPSTQEATVKYITSPGTALAGADYIHTSGTLTFAAGETMKTITVAIVGDEESEPNETFSVSLNTPTGGAVIDRSTATGLILDDGGSFVYLPLIVR